MGSLGAAKRNPTDDLVVTQVSFGGFDVSVGAKKLTEFLELNAGVIWRCRVKKTWTPADSYPDFAVSKDSSTLSSSSAPMNRESDTGDTGAKVTVPHAFVHFAHPDAAKRAIAAAGRSDLILDSNVLRVNSGAESFTLLQRRRNVDPFKFSAAGIELGNLVSRDEFWVAWKCPSGEFVVDPFDGCCQIIFPKEVAFLRKDTKKTITVTCDFKLQFFVRDVDDIKIWKDKAPFAIAIHLSFAPLVYYRTADDDIYESVPFSLLDDDDPWIRTTDFTLSGAIGRCSIFRVLLSPRFGPKLEKAVAYLKEHRVSESLPKKFCRG
ncbi:hypothetical protein HPP92_007973 [Vanilla planifolia]|uniref:Uncharacterized protein n=1 Tax=Vanilla planifolia TaxID=51239 RepID=A0A835RNE8_VANPL|nr:hypothetical protein HPP92_007973 [Vanilla planifolia]